MDVDGKEIEICRKRLKLHPPISRPSITEPIEVIKIEFPNQSWKLEPLALVNA
jgi:hypothetical protein